QRTGAALLINPLDDVHAKTHEGGRFAAMKSPLCDVTEANTPLDVHWRRLQTPAEVFGIPNPLDRPIPVRVLPQTVLKEFLADGSALDECISRQCAVGLPDALLGLHNVMAINGRAGACAAHDHQ
ncbi:MAG TPA: hypothetical protein PKC18_18080, partial [Lacipirellulaceae bacterium]|nr:hypothetical protein [Lacipirellulaceae bacterium]